MDLPCLMAAADEPPFEMKSDDTDFRKRTTRDLAIAEHHIAMRDAMKAIPADSMPFCQFEGQWIKRCFVGKAAMKNCVEHGNHRQMPAGMRMSGPDDLKRRFIVQRSQIGKGLNLLDDFIRDSNGSFESIASLDDTMANPVYVAEIRYAVFLSAAVPDPIEQQFGRVPVVANFSLVFTANLLSVQQRKCGGFLADVVVRARNQAAPEFAPIGLSRNNFEFQRIASRIKGQDVQCRPTSLRVFSRPAKYVFWAVPRMRSHAVAALHSTIL